MNNNIDKGKGILKDKLVDYQVDPPAGLWESISARLKEGKGSRKFIIILSAAASLALAVTLGIHYFDREIPAERELASSPDRESRLEDRVIEVLTEEQTAEVKQSDSKLAIVDRPISDEDGSGHKIESVMNEPGDIEEEGISTEELADEIIAIEELAMDEVDPEEIIAKEDTPVDENLALNAGEINQEEAMMDLNEGRDRDPRWVLGAVLSPLYSFRDAQPEALAGTSGQESGIISYAAGVQVGYRTTRRLAIETGILFNKMGIAIGAPGIQVFSRDQQYEVAGPEAGWGRVIAVNNTVGNIVSNSGEVYINNYLLSVKDGENQVFTDMPESVNAEEGIQQHLDYLELPFNLRYTVLDRDFKIQLLGGMSTNFLVNNYVTMESEGVTTEIGYLSNVRNVNYSGNAGLGFVYHFLDQLSLSVEPRFRYYLNSVNDATLPTTRPYTFGIYTGINYFF